MKFFVRILNLKNKILVHVSISRALSIVLNVTTLVRSSLNVCTANHLIIVSYKPIILVIGN